MQNPRRPWTPDEDEIIKRYYSTGGWRACQKHLPHRTKKSIQSRASALKIRYGDVPGYVTASALAQALDDYAVNIVRLAEPAGAVRRIKNRVLIREDWATDYIEKRRKHAVGEESRMAGYLTTREVARLLRIGRTTALRWVSGQQSWLARRFGRPRVVRGKRGRLLWNPVDVERVRVALEKERQAAKSMRSFKSLTLNLNYQRRKDLLHKARESGNSFITLVHGRLVRFVEEQCPIHQPAFSR